MILPTVMVKAATGYPIPVRGDELSIGLIRCMFRILCIPRIAGRNRIRLIRKPIE
jgi:hypothetical protein